jgi:hypothetical protein
MLRRQMKLFGRQFKHITIAESENGYRSWSSLLKDLSASVCFGRFTTTARLPESIPSSSKERVC